MVAAAGENGDDDDYHDLGDEELSPIRLHIC
jgi:hypothetical protein